MGVYDSDEEWECFLCEGRSYCKVCQGTGNIGKNSVLRKLINSIVDKRVGQIMNRREAKLEKSEIQ